MDRFAARPEGAVGVERPWWTGGAAGPGLPWTADADL